MSNYTFSERSTKSGTTRIDVHDDSKTVAYIRTKPYKKGDFVFVQSLYVAPKHRKQRLSHELLNRVLDKYKTKEIRLEVDPFRDKPVDVKRLKKLYSSHGFKSVSKYEMSRPPLEKSADINRFINNIYDRRTNDIYQANSSNLKLVANNAIPVSRTSEAFLGGEHIFGEAWREQSQSIPMVKELASYVPSFTEELEKTATVEPHQQETQWTCSAACLKAVLSHWGTDLSEQQLTEIVGAKKGRGAECDQIANAARVLGFASFEYSFESIDQAKVLLDQNIPIICDIQSFNNPGKGHYVVMVSADEHSVELMDPNTPGNWRVIPIAEMDQRWWDHAMAPPHDLMPKHGIIVIPSESPDDSY